MRVALASWPTAQSGQFDTPFRPIGEKMRIRLILDPEILEKLCKAKKILDEPVPLT